MITPPTTPAFTIAAITSTIAVTTPKKYGCFVENDINYAGNDIPGAAQFVAGMSDCCNLCGATTGCVVWAYWSTYKFCYLKNALPSITQRQPFPTMFSGIITLR